MLKEFVESNKLDFKEGTRNSNLVVLCGYALFSSLDKSAVCDAIPEEDRTADLDLELDRVWNYAVIRNYGAWWRNEENTKKFKI